MAQTNDTLIRKQIWKNISELIKKDKINSYSGLKYLIIKCFKSLNKEKEKWSYLQSILLFPHNGFNKGKVIYREDK